MRKNFYFILVAIFAATFMTSCGADENGAIEEVLSKKTYAKVISTYDHVNDFFSEGTCIVKSNGKYGVINMKGKEIIPCTHERIYDCSDGMFLFYTKDENYNYWYGFLDKTGKVAIEPQYKDAEGFSDGLALVKKDAKDSWVDDHAFINKKGEIVVDFKTYTRMKSFSDGLAAVNIDNDDKDVWGYINTKGEVVIAPTYDYTYPFSDGVAIVGKNDKEFLIDKKGEVAFIPGKDMEFLEETFSEGLMPVAKGNSLKAKCGFINTKGEEVLPFEYDYAEGFIDGEAYVIKDFKFLVIDKKGEVLEEEILDVDDIEEYLDDILDIF
jgi:hypothetical protein